MAMHSYSAKVQCSSHHHLTCASTQSRCVGPALHQIRVKSHAFKVMTRAGSQDAAPAPDTLPSTSYKHILAAILDANPYLSDGSKQVVSATALMAQQSAGIPGKVTMLVVNEEGTSAKEPATRMETLSWHLRDKGVTQFEVIEKTVVSPPASVLVGDVADEVAADMVIISSEAIHNKFVDANQLAEFVSCAVLLVP